MRLDKFFSTVGKMSRRESSDAIRHGCVTVDGEVIKDPSRHIDPEKQTVALNGKPVMWQEHIYIMLNKPEGTISSTEDSERTVMKLLPPGYERAGCFPCGRLDADTVGLLLITNDGNTAHELLSPKKHVDKTYRFRCSEPLTPEMITKLEGGLDLGDFITGPATVKMKSEYDGTITISEGKFHQIKRMLISVGSGIEFLERITFGPLTLDPSLERGQWRELTADEINKLKNR